MARILTPMTATTALTAALLLLPAAGCSRSLCRGTELSKVKTPAQEASAMQRFWEKCQPLSMSAYEKSGAALPFSDPAWLSKVHHIQLSGGAGAFEHVVIEPKNVLLLMRE